MRLLIAMMQHETNSFSPVPTPLERFHIGGQLLAGERALAAYRGTGSSLGGLIHVAEREGAEVVCPLAAMGWPSGPVHDEAYEFMVDIILSEVRKGGFDGIMLDLHGAMVTETHEDAEGVLLKRIREIDATTPIAVCLDMHGNISPDTIAAATVVCGYHTYPHVDMYETGVRAGSLLIRTIRGELRPTMAYGRNPMLPHVMRQGTFRSPNRELQARCIELEGERVLAASLFVGFPHSDIADPGLSVIVVTDDDQRRAQSACEELLSAAWQARHAFVYAVEPLSDSIARAKAIPPGDGPVVLLDHYDNAASGGTMDTTLVLAEIMRQGLEDVAAFAIRDPSAVEKAISAGVGSEITLSVGGHMAMPAIAQPNLPMEITGRVKIISDGTYRNKGPMSRDVQMYLGPTVVIDTGKVEVIVTSKHQEPNDENAFLSLGIDPRRKRFLMLKSRVHWRAGLGHLAREVVECAGLGVCTSNYAEIPFRRLRRPIFPLDAHAHRVAEGLGDAI